jgi:hypothetical protein
VRLQLLHAVLLGVPLMLLLACSPLVGGVVLAWGAALLEVRAVLNQRREEGRWFEMEEEARGARQATGGVYR